MKSSVLISGSSGLVGSRFTELYADVFNFDLLDLSVGVDITNQVKVFETVKQSSAPALIHLAAFTDVSRASQEQDNQDGLVYRVNVLGTQNIIQACQEFNKYLIHISTDFVFDGTKTEPYTEIDQPSPIEWYGQTKAEAEKLVTASGLPAMIMRLAFPYRAKHRLKLDLVRKIIKGINDQNLPTQFDDILITPTLIDDICQALVLAIEKKPKGIFHCAGSTALSSYDLALKIAQVFELEEDEVKRGNFKDFLKTDPRPRQQYLALANNKIQQELDFKIHTIDEGLEIIKDQGVVA